MLLPVDRYELQHPVSFQVRSTFLHAVRRSVPRPHEISRLRVPVLILVVLVAIGDAVVVRVDRLELLDVPVVAVAGPQ